MPVIYGVLLCPGVNVPQPIKIPMVSGNSVEDSVARVLNVPKVAGAIETDVGSLYQIPVDQEAAAAAGVKLLRNPVACDLLQQYCKNMPVGFQVFGRCFLMDRELSTTNKRNQKPVGEKQPKGPSKALKAVNALFRNLTGRDPETMKKRDGPQKARKPLDFFKRQFHQKLRVEWEAKAQAAWNQLSDAEKKPYEEKAADKANKDKTAVQLYATDYRKAHDAHVDFPSREKVAAAEWASLTEEQKQVYNQKAAEDRERFEREQKALLAKVPKAPKPVRLAHYVYKEQNPNTTDAWISLEDDAKAPYLAVEHKDRLRYEAERKVYEAACDRLGIDYKVKQRKRKVVAAEPAAEESKEKAEPSQKKRKVVATESAVPAPKPTKPKAKKAAAVTPAAPSPKPKAKKPTAVTASAVAAPKKKNKPAVAADESAKPAKKARIAA